MSDLYFALTMLVSLGLIIALWLAARRFTAARWFWGLLAAAWSIGFSGNIAWGLAFPAGAEISAFSWLDLFYLVRDLLVAAAFAVCLRRKLPSTLLLAAVLVPLAAGLGWLVFRPLFWSAPVPRWDWLAGLAMYPLLDVVLLTLAGSLWFSLPAGALKRAVAWLAGGVLAYSLANWINLAVRLVTPRADSPAANLFWLLSDLLTLTALLVFWIDSRKDAPEGSPKDE